MRRSVTLTSPNWSYGIQCAWNNFNSVGIFSFDTPEICNWAHIKVIYSNQKLPPLFDGTDYERIVLNRCNIICLSRSQILIKFQFLPLIGHFHSPDLTPHFRSGLAPGPRRVERTSQTCSLEVLRLQRVQEGVEGAELHLIHLLTFSMIFWLMLEFFEAAAWLRRSHPSIANHLSWHTSC